jgi:hypothetical protein
MNYASFPANSPERVKDDIAEVQNQSIEGRVAGSERWSIACRRGVQG